MTSHKETRDIEEVERVFNELTDRLRLLHDRFLAIAMDYKHYINSEWNNHKIFELRDNVLYRLYSARFHFQLLLEYHYRVEKRLIDFHKKSPAQFFQGGSEITAIQRQSTREIYSLFDSMMYHLCSIYDYLCQLIIYAHNSALRLAQPKWNMLLHEKNKRDFIYCSKDLIPPIEKIDRDFVYPLIKHRSHLIHTKNDTGEFVLTFNLGSDNFNAKFFATPLFKQNFPEILIGNENYELTIKYAAHWLIDKAIKTITEVLFELRDDMVRNKKIPHGMLLFLGPNNTFLSPSAPYWGDRSTT